MTLLNRLPLVLLCLSLVPVQPLLSQTTVVVTGRVYDADTSAPLPGVEVTAGKLPDATNKGPITLFRATSDKNGAFSLQLPPGRFGLCTENRGLYLDPCQWFPGQTLIDTSRSSSVGLPLRKGVLLEVRLLDPDGYVTAARAASPTLASVQNAPISASFTDAAGTVRSLLARGSGAPAFEFSTLVPSNQNFRLQVSSPALRLADQGGNLLVQNLYEESFTSPDGAVAAPPAFSWHWRGPQVPAKILSFIAKGLTSP
jgi:hypothetical protein